MTAVSVNGAAITEPAIAAEVQNHPASTPQAARESAVRALAVRELLLQEAKRIGLTPAPRQLAADRRETEEDALIRQLVEREVSVPEADEETCRRYFEGNRKRFIQPDLFEASHILFSASPDDPAAYERAADEAEATIRTLQERPGAFAEIARERSACTSARDGGRLGQLTGGETVPEFETFLVSLAEGQLCPVPVKTRFGVHVVRLDRRIAGRPLPFEAVRGRIAEYLQEASWRRAVAQYVRVLAGRADVRGVDLGGVSSPLVQ